MLGGEVVAREFQLERAREPRAESCSARPLRGNSVGVPGTVTFNLTGRNNAEPAVKETRTILGASGALAGLQGVLHETGVVVFPTGPVTTYSGRVS